MEGGTQTGRDTQGREGASLALLLESSTGRTTFETKERAVKKNYDDDERMKVYYLPLKMMQKMKQSVVLNPLATARRLRY